MKKFTFATILVIVSLTFVFAACGYSGKIESVQGHGTIYRYKVEEVQLLNADSDKEEILTTTEDFNYYYANDETQLCKDLSIDGLFGKSTLTYYFPSLTMKDSYTCDQYNCKVRIRIMLGRIDKEYRPDYSVEGELVTYSYYCMDPFSITDVSKNKVGDAFKKEINFAEYTKIQKEYYQEMDSINAMEFLNFIKEFNEKYQYYIAIYSMKETVSVSSGFNVQYHP